MFGLFTQCCAQFPNKQRRTHFSPYFQLGAIFQRHYPLISGIGELGAPPYHAAQGGIFHTAQLMGHASGYTTQPTHVIAVISRLGSMRVCVIQRVLPRHVNVDTHDQCSSAAFATGVHAVQRHGPCCQTWAALAGPADRMSRGDWVKTLWAIPMHRIGGAHSHTTEWTRPTPNPPRPHPHMPHGSGAAHNRSYPRMRGADRRGDLKLRYDARGRAGGHPLLRVLGALHPLRLHHVAPQQGHVHRDVSEGPGRVRAEVVLKDVHRRRRITAAEEVRGLLLHAFELGAGGHCEPQ